MTTAIGFCCALAALLLLAVLLRRSLWMPKLLAPIAARALKRQVTNAAILSAWGEKSAKVSLVVNGRFVHSLITIRVNATSEATAIRAEVFVPDDSVEGYSPSPYNATPQDLMGLMHEGRTVQLYILGIGEFSNAMGKIERVDIAERYVNLQTVATIEITAGPLYRTKPEDEVVLPRPSAKPAQASCSAPN